MKDCLITLIGMSILIFTSCSNNQFTIDMPIIHDSIEIDIDEDDIADYKIRYSELIVEPLTLSDGVEGIAGLLQPYGENEILRHREEGSLFLRKLEEIEENVVEPLKWRNTFSRTIVSIVTINAEGEWPNKWDINSNSEHSTYFFGLKMVSVNVVQLAWVEIDINTNNGSVSIVDKGIL